MTTYELGRGFERAPSAEELRHEHYRKALANVPEDQRGENPVTPAAERWYWPDHDIYDMLPDGRAIIACPAGQPMPIAEARRRGLVPSDDPPAAAAAENAAVNQKSRGRRA